MNSSQIEIRPCQGFVELSECVQLQMDVWGYGDRDVVPRRVFIVAQKVGGQVMGAFDGGRLVGFAMAVPGISQGRPYLHSHMLAVNPDYRNRGIGRRLKLFQRDEALGRGIERMEWTFDPLEIKNSFLNIARLGTIVRRYAPNFYGLSPSPLHGQIPTDRLCAEWWLESDRVRSTLDRSKPASPPEVEYEITVPHQISHWRHSAEHRERALDIQSRNREHFEEAFARRLAVIGFRMDGEGNGLFQLGRWQEPELPGSSQSLQPISDRFS
jgi:predicted GNAT superfamily acetyltransferase